VQQTTESAPDTAFETECEDSPLLFQDLGPRKVVADFSGGYLSSDGGALLLRQLDRGLGVLRGLRACFQDHRHPVFIEHSLEELLTQRVYGLALGYEDLNDHQHLRLDPLLAVSVGKVDPLAVKRGERDQGKALAGAATLNRLELGNEKQSRCHKITHAPEQIAAHLLRSGVRCLPQETTEVILDFDASDHPLHGHQEGRFFHGYDREYCYLPLFCFAGEVPLWAQLRTADRDASEGTVEALAQIVAEVRRRLPQARIVVRGDSGFCREAIMAWCEAQGIYFVLGLARNARLEALLRPSLEQAREKHCLCGGAATRVFQELRYRTVDSWSRERRVIGKAEVTAQGDNPRFIVTNLPTAEEAAALEGWETPAQYAAQPLYEETYCGRGEMENQIKQLHLDLHADRVSTHHLGSNQLRLWLSAFAYLLLERLRTVGLAGTELARTSLGGVRLRLLKIAAQVEVRVRRVYVRLASACPWQRLFRQCAQRLAQMPVAAG
jgi:Transposase DDE domain group 1